MSAIFRSILDLKRFLVLITSSFASLHVFAQSAAPAESVTDLVRPKFYFSNYSARFSDFEINRLNRVAELAGIELVYPDREYEPEQERKVVEHLIRLHRVDGVIANLNPMLSPGAHEQTAFDMGFAFALGKPVFGFRASHLTFFEETQNMVVRLNLGPVELGPQGMPVDRAGISLEKLGTHEDNLMLTGSIYASGSQVYRSLNQLLEHERFRNFAVGQPFPFKTLDLILPPKITADRRKKIYLAGPNVFFPDRSEVETHAKEVIERIPGLMGLIPSDGQLTPGADLHHFALEIFFENLALMRIAEGAAANVVPWRGGVFIDSGTAWEIGFMIGSNKPVWGYVLEPKINGGGTVFERMLAKQTTINESASQRRDHWNWSQSLRATVFRRYFKERGPGRTSTLPMSGLIYHNLANQNLEQGIPVTIDAVSLQIDQAFVGSCLKLFSGSSGSAHVLPRSMLGFKTGIFGASGVTH